MFNFIMSTKVDPSKDSMSIQEGEDIVSVRTMSVEESNRLQASSNWFEMSEIEGEVRNELCAIESSVDKVMTTIGSIWNYIDSIDLKFEAIEDSWTNLGQEVRQMKKFMGMMEKQAVAMEERILEIGDRPIEQRARSRRNNLFFHGVEENAGESSDECKKVVEKLIRDGCKILEPVKIEMANRLGPRRSLSMKNERPRPIIARFKDINQRELVWNASNQLPKNIWISEDLPWQIRQARAILTKDLKEAKRNSKDARIAYPARLLVDGNEVKAIHPSAMRHPSGQQRKRQGSDSLQGSDKVRVADEMFDTSYPSMSAWSTYLPLESININRPIYNIQTLRDQYLRMDETGRSFKSKVYGRIRQCCFCNKRKLKNIVLNIFPFINIMRMYNLGSDLINDVIAGLTVGIMQLPQGLAYGTLANLPPVVGLYMSFFPVVVYFFFATSKHISMGTEAVTSQLTGRIVYKQTEIWAEAVARDPEATWINDTKNFAEYFGNSLQITPEEQENIDAFKIAIACSISIITGIFQVTMGLCRAGFVTTYMGDSLVSGFTTGAAVHVFTSQVKNVFGIEIKPPKAHKFEVPNTYIAVVTNISKTNIPTLILAISCLVILYIVKVYINMRYHHKLKMPVPIELIIVILTTVASSYVHFNEKYGIKTVGKIPKGIPEPSFPTFKNISNIHDYVLECLIVAIVAFAQSISLAVLMAKKHHYEIDANKELIGYGMGNFIGSFFACYPFAAAMSRTTVQDSTGGRTQVVTLVSASMVLIVIQYFGPLFESLPICALSAIIMVALRNVFLQVLELRTLLRVSPYDCLIWIATCLCVVIVHVDWGLFIGILVSILTVVCRSQTAKVRTLQIIPGVDEYRPVSLYKKTESTPLVRIVSYNSPLFFANSELFIKHVYKETKVAPKHVNQPDLDEEEFKVLEMELVAPLSKTNIHQPFEYLVIDCSSFTFIDPVGIKTLQHLIEDYKTIGITTFLAAVKDDPWYTMEQSGFTKMYENILFLTVRDAVHAAEEDNEKKAISSQEQITMDTDLRIRANVTAKP